MIEANVVKNDNTDIVLTKLTKKECNDLKQAITGHGKLKAAIKATGLNTMTIKRARMGEQLRQENADKIRTFLNSL